MKAMIFTRRYGNPASSTDKRMPQMPDAFGGTALDRLDAAVARYAWCNSLRSEK
jgi:hypothetical protein